MSAIADLMMIAGTFGVVGYCFILSGRLKKFASLDTTMGSAIAILSGQVDELTRALDAAKSTAATSASHIDQLSVRAEATAARLEVLLATMHDLPHATTSGLHQGGGQPTRMRVLRRSERRFDKEAAE